MKRNFLIGLGLTLAASTAFAADNGVLPSASTPGAAANAGVSVGASAGVDFGSLDTNADGKLTRAEVKSNTELSARFKALDKNKDGKLSSDEYAARNADAAGGSGLDKPIN